MASTTAIAIATIPLTSTNRNTRLVSSNAFSNPMKLHHGFVPLASSRCQLKVRASASMKEKAVSGLTAAALVAALVIPEVAEAAQPGLSPSLKNFLLSIVAGGVVLTVITGAVIAVANFDPVKRS